MLSRLKIGVFIALCASLGAAIILPAARPAPQPQSSLANNPQMIEDLVYANRILYQQDVLDGFGHVSVRSDKDPSHFLMARSMPPALVTSNDIMEYDRMGEPVDARDRKSYLERYIHAAIYRVRPDVMAIVHSHSPEVIPFGVTGTTLRPLYHMSAFLGAGAPIFDIRDDAGATDMLVRNNTLGDALAKSLGSSYVVLMRGHGFVAVANSIPRVVLYSIYTPINARLQAEAMKLGKVEYLSPEEAVKAAAGTDAGVGRPWELWKSLIGKIQ